jgi:hypothetical protein
VSFTAIAAAIADSRLHASALWLLSDVPGAPPLVQTVHLLSVVAIMGSIVLIDLRVLGLALPSQDAPELARRLLPWTWCALPVLAASGLVFVFAQPHRYFANPVFGIKFALLGPAVLLTLLLQRALGGGDPSRPATASRRAVTKTLALLSLFLWVGVVMAGRWIAYADYLFPEWS